MRAETHSLPKPKGTRDRVGPQEGKTDRAASLPAQRTVLVVEDEWLVRAEIADALTAAGWEVVEAASGEEAVETLASQKDIDLLVTDIRLLGALDGWDVAEAFRATMPSGLVIYASANPTRSARPVPGATFVDKPTRMGHLVSASESLWRSLTRH